MSDKPEPPPERPRQLTGKETLELKRQITKEEWEPIRLQLIAEEEARAARMRARIYGKQADTSEGEESMGGKTE
jgi:hypothetical protein